MWWIAGIFIVLGGALAYLTWEATEYEYPFTWWMGWSLMAMGVLLIIAMYNPLREQYLIWSSVVAACFLAAFLIGPIDDEYLPPAWIAVSVLVSNAIIFLVKDNSSFDLLIVGVLFVAAIGALFYAAHAREHDEYYYDLGYSAFWMLLFSGCLILFHTIRTPLQYLNEVTVPQHAELRTEMTNNLSAYQAAVEQASQCRDVIGADFVEDGNGFLDMAQAYFPTASSHYETADDLSKEVRSYEVVTEWSQDYQDKVEAEIAIASQAIAESRAALDDLGKVCDLYRNLAQEWVRDYLWFEVDSYWPSEASDSNHKACYYGEYFTLIDADRNLTETIVSDEVELPTDQQQTGWLAPDNQGRNWKIFTVDDYIYLVNEGIVPPMDKASPSETDIGYYLCGQNPQNNEFGVLGEPPIRLAKERGVIKVEQEDEDLYVGNYDYGAWCVQDATGKWQEISEDEDPPADAEWCVYQPEGESTGYHYYRRYNPDNTWIYIRGPRRCHYCTSTNWPSGGGTVVPNQRMAEFNQTDVSTLRRPADVGGGPGAGK